MKKVSIYGVVAALSVVVLVACGKKADDKGSDVGRAGNRVVGPAGLPAMSYSRQIINIVNNSGQLEVMAKALASASVDPQYVGRIRSVQMQGDVSVDQNTGNILTNNSAVQIIINDEYVGQSDGNGGTVEPITIFVPGLNGGASNGNVNLTFGDNYGTITITGTYNGSTVNGTVSFNNTQGAGYNNVRSGTLGQFSVPVCSFFHCRN